jgi:phosphoglycerate dehydrogenase-like enzyme
MPKPTGLFILPKENYELIYSPQQVAWIAELVDLLAPQLEPQAVRDNPALLAGVELVFTGWGSLTYAAEILQAAPDLKMVFYGAGSVRSTVTDAFWERGVRITSAWGANAVPVVEYCLAQILLCLKKTHQHAAAYRSERSFLRLPVAGGYGSTIGLISLGMIGRMLAERLKTFDLQVIAHDPFVLPETAARLGVEMVSLDEVFSRGDVVSLHTPWLDSTGGMIRGEHFARMKPGASFINTARGAVVREEEMVEALQQRPDLYAVLDVTWPEPPASESPLFTLPNVFLTPHIAGSMNGECHRMGRYMLEELERYLQGQPLKYEVTRERAVLLG